MSNIKLLFLIFIMLLTSCSVLALDADNVNLTIIRESGSQGSFVSMDFNIDAINTFSLNSGESKIISLSKGKHLIVYTIGKTKCSRYVNVEKKLNLSYQFDIACDLKIMPEPDYPEATNLDSESSNNMAIVKGVKRGLFKKTPSITLRKIDGRKTDGFFLKTEIKVSPGKHIIEAACELPTGAFSDYLINHYMFEIKNLFEPGITYQLNATQNSNDTCDVAIEKL